jgi:hypothetical protein
MGSPTKCFAEARKFLPPEVMADIETRASELRGQGMSAAEAARAAVAESQTAGKARLDEVEVAAASGRQLFDPEPAAEIASDPMSQILAQFPDLRVQMDDMDQAVPLRELLDRVKQEADDDLAEVPLIEAAANCFLRTGGAVA